MESQDIKVGPLTQDECRQVVIARTNKDTDTIRRRAVELFQETGGNAYLLNELIDCFDPDTDSFTPLPLNEVIDRKLKVLPSDAESLLNVIAISGQALSLEEASHAAGQRVPAMSTLTHMRTERLVRLLENEERPFVDTYHDRIRETVVDQLDSTARRAVHLRLAETIERNENLDGNSILDQLNHGEFQVQNTPRVYDLAYHFDAAGQHGKALAYSTLAAEEAKGQFALETAIEQYTTAHRNLDGTSDSMRYRLSVGFGETLALSGRYADAETVLLTANEYSSSQLDGARIDTILAGITYKTKSLSESIAACENVLRQLGNWVPRTRMAVLARAIWESFVQFLHSSLPSGWFVRQGVPSEKMELTWRLLIQIDYPLFFRDAFKVWWTTTYLLNSAERFPKSPYCATANTHHANVVMAMIGWASRGEKRYRRALSSAKQRDDIFEVAHSLRMYGWALHGVGRLEEGRDLLAEALQILTTNVGDAWSETYTRYWISCVDFRLGNLADAAEQSSRAFHAALQFGQHRLAQSSIEVWTRALGGILPFDKLKECFQAVPDDYTSAIQCLMAESHWHLLHRRTAEAVEVAEQGFGLLRRHWILNIHTVSAISTLARALREHAGSLHETDSRQAARLRSRALRIARWSVRISRFLRLELPVAFRELSLALAAKGRTKKALKYAQKSCDVAKEQKARYEHAQSLLVCGQLANQLGRPEAQSQIDEATSALMEFDKMIEAATTQFH